MIRRPPRSTLFPTRRSSDLYEIVAIGSKVKTYLNGKLCVDLDDPQLDRKSTRLNSSHVEISYAVFCLKKKLMTVHIAFLVDFMQFVHHIHPNLLSSDWPSAH